MEIEQEFRAIVGALNDAKIPYAVCGGFAVIIHGFPRLTEDIDLLVREEDLPAVRSAVRPLGFTIDSGSFVFKRGQPDESRFTRVLKVFGEEFLLLDLMSVTLSLEAAFAKRESIEVEGLKIQVIGREGLRQMKLSASRPKDLEDLRKLKLDGT